MIKNLYSIPHHYVQAFINSKQKIHKTGRKQTFIPKPAQNTKLVPAAKKAAIIYCFVLSNIITAPSKIFGRIKFLPCSQKYAARPAHSSGWTWPCVNAVQGVEPARCKINRTGNSLPARLDLVSAAGAGIGFKCRRATKRSALHFPPGPACNVIRSGAHDKSHGFVVIGGLEEGVEDWTTRITAHFHLLDHSCPSRCWWA